MKKLIALTMVALFSVTSVAVAAQPKKAPAKSAPKVIKKVHPQYQHTKTGKDANKK